MAKNAQKVLLCTAKCAKKARILTEKNGPAQSELS
jgi:hypothetical protein